MMVHKHAAAKRNNVAPPKAFPVKSTRVHEWLREYLGNYSVQWIDGNTLIIWNSPAHKKMMS